MNSSNSSDKKEFYQFTINLLNEHEVEYLIGGAYAFREYTGIYRDTKDIDLFCKYGEHEKIIRIFSDRGFSYEITDVRWLAKIFRNEDYVDIIFSNPNNICSVDDSWFEHAKSGWLFDQPVLYMSPVEMIWSKIFVQDRERFDGSDINHIILKQGNQLDWQRLFQKMRPHWQLLLAQLLNFQYVYPSDRDIVPQWLIEELTQLLVGQYDLSPPQDRVCRGPYLDNQQYEIDIKEWGYKAITNKTV